MAEKQKKAELKTIVQIPLFPEDVQEITTFKMTDADILKSLSVFVEDGLEFKIMKSGKTTGYSVLVQDTKPESKNAGQGFYANGDSLKAALVCAFYKINLPNGQQWSTFGASRIQTNSIS